MKYIGFCIAILQFIATLTESSPEIENDNSKNDFFEVTEFQRITAAISAGQIAVSPQMTLQLNFRDLSIYSSISICVNRNSLRKGLNGSLTSVFVCPWRGRNYRFCCGGPTDGRCCRYFDRPSVLSALIIGIILIVLIIFACAFRYYKKHRSKMQSAVSIQHVQSEIVSEKVLDINGLPIIVVPDTKSYEMSNFSRSQHSNVMATNIPPPDYTELAGYKNGVTNQIDMKAVPYNPDNQNCPPPYSNISN